MDLSTTLLLIASISHDTIRRHRLYDAACQRWSEHAVAAGLCRLADEGLIHYAGDARKSWLTETGATVLEGARVSSLEQMA